MGAFVVQMLISVWVIFYFYGKLFTAVDTDGELKQTASKEFLSWLDRRLK